MVMGVFEEITGHGSPAQLADHGEGIFGSAMDLFGKR
jgi:hypothetical protein